MGCCSGSSDPKYKELCAVRKIFAIFAFGVFLTYSSYISMVNLQSSINIKDGLGTIAVATTYASAVLCTLLITPIVIRKFGAKRAIIAGEITYIFFLLANLYPEFYTLVPAAVIVGFGEATVWPCMSMIYVFFAIQYSKIMGDDGKGDEYYISKFGGYFFTFFQCSQIFGNLVAYVVLYALNDKISANSTNSDTNTTSFPGLTTSAQLDEFYYCGANDCQDADVVNENINQYVPTNEITIYILIAIFTVMCLATQLIHISLLPDFGSYAKTQKTAVKLDEQNQTQNIEHQGKQSFHVDIKDEKRNRTFIINTIKSVGQHLIKTKQFLLLPITIYDGLLLGFVFSDLTRAFSSCVTGVANVGIHSSIMGVANVMTSFAVGRFGKRIGRTVLYTIALVVDTGNYLYCLLWPPETETSWSIYLIFFSFGFTNGIWQTLLSILHVEYFPEQYDIALTVWNMAAILGLAIQFSWSAALCVSTKAYVQIGMLYLGYTCYSIAERLQKKDLKKIREENAIDKDSNTTAYL